jgi:hypothetical protein
MLRSRLWRLAVLPLLCGGCNLVFGITGGTEEALVVTPATTTLLARTTVQLTATLGGNATPVTWKLLEPGVGTLTPAGLYTAPASTASIQIEATTVAMPPLTARATLRVVQMAVPTILTSTGELQTATGQGTQSHLAYAEGTAQWWLFRDDPDGETLGAMVSDDFTHWKKGGSIALPSGITGDGRDLSIAYASLGGRDVVHVSQGFGVDDMHGRYHLRAALSQDTASFDDVQVVNPGGAKDGGGASPDGTSTIVLSTGLVIDTTGFERTAAIKDLPGGLTTNCGGGDVDLYTSDVTDDGAASFAAAKFGAQVLWCVPEGVRARQLLAFGDTLVLLYVDGGSVLSTGGDTTVLMDLRPGSTGFWAPDEATTTVTPPLVFSNDTAGQDPNDWTAAVQGGAVHAVRRSGSAFDHRVMTTPRASSSAWSDGPAIPSWPTQAGSGLFLAPYGAGLILLALDASGSNLLYTAFDGGSWSPWTTLAGTGTDGAGASYLSGFAPASGAKPAVIWTNPVGSSYGIAGLELP